MKVSFSKKVSEPEKEGGMKINYAPARRHVSKALWWLLLAVVFSPFVWLLVTMMSKWFLLSSPGVVYLETVEVRSPARGVVERAIVGRGQSVREGDPVFIVAARPSAADIGELERVTAELDAGRNAAAAPAAAARAPRPTASMYKRLEYLRGEERAYFRLMRQGAATKAEYDQARERLLAAQSDIEALRAASVPRLSADSASQKGRELYLKEYAALLKKRIGERYTIRAIRSGVIENVAAVKGADVDEGAALATISDPTAPLIVAYVYPEDYNRSVKIGKKAKVKLPNGERITAAVVERPATSQSVPGGLSDSILAGRRSVLVFLKPDRVLADEELVNGLPVNVSWGARILGLE